MRFSDTTQIQVPQPTKYANSDSSPFNSDESLSDDDSQTFMTPSSTEDNSQKSIAPSTTLTPSNTSKVLSRKYTICTIQSQICNVPAMTTHYTRT